MQLQRLWRCRGVLGGADDKLDERVVLSSERGKLKTVCDQVLLARYFFCGEWLKMNGLLEVKEVRGSPVLAGRRC